MVDVDAMLRACAAFTAEEVGCAVEEGADPPEDDFHLVPWPVTLAMFRASQGRRWQGRRTKAHWTVRRGRGRSQRRHLAVLNAANVSGRGTRDEANHEAPIGGLYRSRLSNVGLSGGEIGVDPVEKG